MQRKALTQGKNLALCKDTFIGKGKGAVEVEHKKIENRTEAEKGVELRK